ncbi:MAG: carboxypeptidase-like regulatory domain-containing protein [Planctomycetota bacterium]
MRNHQRAMLRERPSLVSPTLREGAQDTRAARGAHRESAVSERAHEAGPGVSSGVGPGVSSGSGSRWASRSGARALSRGSASVAPLLLLALVALGALAFFMGRGAPAPSATGSVLPQPTAERAAPAAAQQASALADERRASNSGAPMGMIEAGPIQYTDSSEWSQLGKVFDGTGTIAVDLRVAPGVPDPTTWTLHLTPSPFVAGREQAVSRELEFTRGERSVEAIDLPMAAYRVFASAPGLMSSPQDVVLHKLAGHEHLPGMNFVRVALTLETAGQVWGTIVESSGRPAADLAVTLREVGGDRRASATTNGNGVYRFEDVLPGSWALLIGDVDRPLLPTSKVETTSGDLELPTLTLPELVHIEVLVVDDLERPLPGAEVSGFRRANGAGSFRGTTDAVGRYMARYFQPGPWRFDGVHEELDREGRLDIEVKLTGDGRDGAGPDGVQHVTVYLPPRPKLPR